MLMVDVLVGCGGENRSGWVMIMMMVTLGVLVMVKS